MVKYDNYKIIGQLVADQFSMIFSKILLEESGDAYELYSFMDKDGLFYII